MKRILVFALIALSTAAASADSKAKYITDVLEVGCGWSDLVYDNIASMIPVKAKFNMPMESKGAESGRRFFMYADLSWFVTFEFFSKVSTEKDITCIMDVGRQDTLKNSLNFNGGKVPEWKWGPSPAAPINQ